VRVELVDPGEPDRHGNGAWRMSWTDGPTVPTMRAEIARRAERYPAVDGEHLGYFRGGTDQATAARIRHQDQQ
jgi:hypothetical protein